jgi:hypothetical protein
MNGGGEKCVSGADVGLGIVAAAQACASRPTGYEYREIHVSSLAKIRETGL